MGSIRARRRPHRCCWTCALWQDEQRKFISLYHQARFVGAVRRVAVQAVVAHRLMFPQQRPALVGVAVVAGLVDGEFLQQLRIAVGEPCGLWQSLHTTLPSRIGWCEYLNESARSLAWQVKHCSAWVTFTVTGSFAACAVWQSVQALSLTSCALPSQLIRVPPSWQLRQTSLRTFDRRGVRSLEHDLPGLGPARHMGGAVAVAAIAAALRHRRAPIALHRHRALQNGGDLRVACHGTSGRHARWPGRPRSAAPWSAAIALTREAATSSAPANSSFSASFCFISVPLVLAWRGSLSSLQPKLIYCGTSVSYFFLSDGVWIFLLNAIKCMCRACPGKVSGGGTLQSVQRRRNAALTNEHCEFLASTIRTAAPTTPHPTNVSAKECEPPALREKW